MQINSTSYFSLSFIYLLTVFALVACDGTGSNSGSITEADSVNNLAEISSVTSNGEPGNYNFSVTISSPDTGCDSYADWWEVISRDGNLIYRRILNHSHVNEQPFTRNGGPVNIAAGDNVIIRAHMNSTGYGAKVFSGSVVNGFRQESINSSFAPELEIIDPLPTGCAF